MATRDITDKMVIEAYAEYAAGSAGRTSFVEGEFEYPYDILMRKTGLSFKECWRACERAADRDLIEYGVSLRTGWITEEGKKLIA
jgi:hypothetical protein